MINEKLLPGLVIVLVLLTLYLYKDGLGSCLGYETPGQCSCKKSSSSTCGETCRLYKMGGNELFSSRGFPGQPNNLGSYAEDFASRGFPGQPNNLGSYAEDFSSRGFPGQPNNLGSYAEDFASRGFPGQPNNLGSYREDLSNDSNYEYDTSSQGGFDPYPAALNDEDLDYDSWRKEISLDDNVLRNHHQFMEDVARTSKGAAHWTVREEPDPVAWRGIRRPNYHAVTENDDARVVSGFLPDNLPYKNTSFRL